MNGVRGLVGACMAAVMPTMAVACSEGVLFSCPIGENQLAICTADGSAIYSFGPAGQPELELTEPFTTLNYHPWVGVGRWEQNWVAFTNGEFKYRVSSARDRLDDERQELWEVGVTVSRAGERIASLTCNTTFAQNVLAPLWSAKIGAGLCWSREHWRWQPPEQCGKGECAC
jgi:hypothetical protein